MANKYLIIALTTTISHQHQSYTLLPILSRMADRFTNVVKLTKFLQSTKGFDRVVSKLKNITFGTGRCSAEVTVDESHTNPWDVLHGGFSATLVDVVSSLALLSQDEKPNGSIELHMSYLKAAKIGDELLVDASIIRKGRKLAFLEVEIKNKSSGDVIVKGFHTKFIF